MPEVITNNLDLWTSALLTKSTAGRGNNGKLEAYGIKKLRELILELAVRGKLVSQDPNDEPARVLLEQLTKEKARLVNEGKLGNKKPLQNVTPEEIPFAIPANWEWVRLGDIGDIFNGNSISERVKETKYTGITGGLPFIATKDVGYGWQDLDYNNGVSIPNEEPNFKVAHKGSVLICAEGGSAGKKCGITAKDICFGNKLFAIEPYIEIESNFLLANYLTATFFAQFKQEMTGIIGGISLAGFNRLIVPLPSIKEQDRIVAKVKELMALCDQLEQQQTDSIEAHQTLVEILLGTLTSAASPEEFAEAWFRIADHFDTLFTTEQSIDRLKQTILQLAVMGKLVLQDPNDEPVDLLLTRVTSERHAILGSSAKQRLEVRDVLEFDIPDSWRWQAIGNLLTFGPTNGFSPQAVDFETPVRSLTLSATTSGTFKGEHFKYIATEVPTDSELWLQSGDILVQRGNTIEYVGVSAVYHGEPNQFIYPDLMMKLRVSSALDVEFVHIAMNHEPAREYLRARATGTSGTMPKINQATLKSLPIPIPPLSEQRRIVAKVDELMALCDALKERLVDAQTIQIHLADGIVEQTVA